jgi:hypothetical protein
MKIRQLPVETLDKVLLVPRAIVAVSINQFAEKFHFDLVNGSDDLDTFEAIVLALGKMPFTLTHHAGNEKGQTTISLPINIAAVSDIAAAYRSIAAQLDIDDKLIVWQQDRDDPPRKFA